MVGDYYPIMGGIVKSFRVYFYSAKNGYR